MSDTSPSGLTARGDDGSSRPGAVEGGSSKPSISRSPVRPARSGTRLAWADLRETLALWRLGVMLGWLDIRLRYRGSVLGPFWLTITSALMVASMGAVYGSLFHMKLAVYLPFLSLSLMLWQTGLSSLLLESCTCFVDADASIRSVRQPFLLQALRVIVRNAIVFGHSIVVPVAVFAIYRVWPGVDALLAVPGLAIWMLDGFAACMLLGSLCARFRDVPPIVGSLMQIVFYVTPIIWKPDQLGVHSRLLAYNPFYALLEIVRGPLMGAVPSGALYRLAVLTSVVFCALAVAVFVRVRGRLVFWI